MRDHSLKIEAGRIEDAITALIAKVESAEQTAVDQGAPSHAEFYEDMLADLDQAKWAIVQVYTSLLNGDERLGIEPLEDETSLFVDTFGDEGKWYVFDDRKGGSEVAGPFDTVEAATSAKLAIA